MAFNAIYLQDLASSGGLVLRLNRSRLVIGEIFRGTTMAQAAVGARDLLGLANLPEGGRLSIDGIFFTREHDRCLVGYHFSGETRGAYVRFEEVRRRALDILSRRKNSPLK